VKRTRGLWASIIIVVALVVASLVGFATGALKPLLGLDLQGGVSVILSAPEGTDQGVMERTRDNISNRVDAFGVGEPDIIVSGNTIEVQIPGLSKSTIEERPKTQYCLIGSEGDSYGCADDQKTAAKALDALRIVSTPTQVCLVSGDTQLDCLGSRDEAKNAKAQLTIAPKGSGSSSPSASGSAATPAPSSSTPEPSEGPSPAPDQWCLVDATGAELGCYDTKDEATAAKDAIAFDVTESSWCITGQPAPVVTPPSPSAGASPSASSSKTASATKAPKASGSASASASTSASASASSSASPSASPTPPFEALDLTDATKLPCGLASKKEAQTALTGIDVTREDTEFCVVSSAGEDLGCFVSRDAAETRQRQTGQERLLEVIGQTARLEERVTLQIITPQTPEYEATPVTCSTPEERATDKCTFDALAGQEVVYADAQGTKYRLGPVVISGSNFKKATAQLEGGTPTNPVTQWAVQFELDGAGSDAFSKATQIAVNAAPPQNQIAIVVDRQIISDPTVQDPITNGVGVITGSFTEQEAKDLATQLNAGALPVELTRQSVSSVSATLGEESLHQGIVAGVVGLALLFLYLLFYYRLLGIVAWLGMSIWAVLAIALVSLAGESFGYALTLAGVAGLVISLGITADSYIVFFERLKDEVRSGRSPRAAVQPGFKRSFRTIVAADVVTGIAAAVLYLTAVSSVRGFALTLGVATALDLFVVYFFKRPTVFLIARNKRLVEMHGFGLTSGVAGEEERGIEPAGEGA
jgi:protein-export membrane protein SecD